MYFHVSTDLMPFIRVNQLTFNNHTDYLVGKLLGRRIILCLKSHFSWLCTAIFYALISSYLKYICILISSHHASMYNSLHKVYRKSRAILSHGGITFWSLVSFSFWFLFTFKTVVCNDNCLTSTLNPPPMFTISETNLALFACE